MLKQAKTWKLQPEAGGTTTAVPDRTRNALALVNGSSAVPRFNYELSPGRWDRLGTSLVLHAVGLLLLLKIAAWMPVGRVEPVRISKSVPLIAPAPVLKPPIPIIKITPPPPRVLAQLHPPPKPTVVPPVPIPEPPKVEPPKVEVKPQPVEVVKTVPPPEMPKPAPPKKEVVVNTFDSGSSAPPTLKEPAHKVQTGGFGDPNGVQGSSEKKAAVTVASLGSFDLPAGPGRGNGTGGAKGDIGAIKSAGFGDGPAGAGSGDHGPRGAVTPGGFGDANATAGPKARTAEAKPAVTPVEITFKPRPIYTDEGRKMRVEGEVLLEITFTASGELRIQRVVKSLGHGLDEAAQRAAEQIRFKPAKRDGQPYDSTALVHINFQLAE